MRWNDGDIDLDADELDPDDSDAAPIIFDDADSPALNQELDESLKLEREERRKNLDISFSVPVLDLSDCNLAETAAAWVESPRLMLETLTFRLNEILEKCEPRSYGFVLELKREHISRQGMSVLMNMACTLNRCGYIVDLVNTIQPTPFKGEVLVKLGKSILPGRTSELTRLINCYKRELKTLAVWIKAKDIKDGKEPSVAPLPIELIPPPLASNQTQSTETNVIPEVANDVVVRNTMRRLTKGWRIEYGSEARDVDLVGFDYIAQLVNAAGNEVSTNQLLGNENEPAFAHDPHSPQPMWDTPTRKAVNDRIQELKAKIELLNIECNEAKEENNVLEFDESNEARMKLFDEFNELRAQKREAIGKSGRTRELNPPNRKAHDNVRKRIDGAREHLKAKGLLKLHQHFLDFIQPNGKGSAYIYCPEPKVEWEVIFQVE